MFIYTLYTPASSV